MELHFSSGRSYDIFGIEGEITISSLVNTASTISKHVQDNPYKNLALDLSQVSYVDSSGIRFFLNLHKKKKEQNRTFFLIGLPQSIKDLIDDTNLDNVLTILDSLEDLEEKTSNDEFDKYIPYTINDDGDKLLKCTCPICGSDNTAGYLINENSYNWSWEENNPYPIAHIANNEDVVDVFAMQPIVCLDCFMVSINPENFNFTDNNSIAIKSSLNDRSKMLLSKSIKKRKAMLDQLIEEQNETVPEGFIPEKYSEESYFFSPRSKQSVYVALKLAEFCSRTIAVNQDVAGPFSVGYLNYLAIKYSGNKQKEELINSCRTWFTQALNKIDSLSTIEIAISRFVLIVADINLGKVKEAGVIYSDFLDMVNNLPQSENLQSITSPRFWFLQADAFWKEEIATKTKNLKKRKVKQKG